MILDDYVENKVLDRITEIIGIEKTDNTKILIDTDDKLSDDVTLKDIVILVTCFTKDDNFIHKYS